MYYIEYLINNILINITKRYFTIYIKPYILFFNKANEFYFFHLYYF